MVLQLHGLRQDVGSGTGAAANAGESGDAVNRRQFLLSGFVPITLQTRLGVLVGRYGLPVFFHFGEPYWQTGENQVSSWSALARAGFA